MTSSANIRKQLPTSRSTWRLFFSCITQCFLVLFIGAELENKCGKGFCWGSMNMSLCHGDIDDHRCVFCTSMYFGIFWAYLKPALSQKSEAKWIQMAPPWSCTGRPCFDLKNGTTKSMRRTSRRRWNWAWNTPHADKSSALRQARIISHTSHQT